MITIDIQQVKNKKKRNKSGRSKFRVQGDFNSYVKGKYINPTRSSKKPLAYKWLLFTMPVIIVAAMKLMGLI